MARFLKLYMALSYRCRAVAHPYREDRPAPQRHCIEDSARRVMMPVSYTNRKGLVSLVKDRPSLIQPEEVAAVEAVVQQHPDARRYRVAVKRDRIEIYEQVGPDYDAVFSDLHIAGLSSPGLAEQLRAVEEHYARYAPVLRFILLDPAQQRFGAERMCYLGSIDGWLELGRTGPVAKLARALIPTLGTDQFYELW